MTASALFFICAFLWARVLQESKSFRGARGETADAIIFVFFIVTASILFIKGII